MWHGLACSATKYMCRARYLLQYLFFNVTLICIVVSDTLICIIVGDDISTCYMLDDAKYVRTWQILLL